MDERIAKRTILATFALYNRPSAVEMEDRIMDDRPYKRKKRRCEICGKTGRRALGLDGYVNRCEAHLLELISRGRIMSGMWMSDPPATDLKDVLYDES